MSLAEDILREAGVEAAVPANGGLRAAPKLNPQLYQSGSELEQDYLEDPEALHNPKMPNLQVQHEAPVHRLIIFMKASGASNREIARAVGYSEPWVSQVLRQPWAQQRLVKELKEAGQDTVQSILKSAAEDSVLTLISIRDDTAAKNSDRLTATNSLLDRIFGKPVQRVHTDNVHRQAGSVEEIEAELERLEHEEKKLLPMPVREVA